MTDDEKSKTAEKIRDMLNEVDTLMQALLNDSYELHNDVDNLIDAFDAQCATEGIAYE